MNSIDKFSFIKHRASKNTLMIGLCVDKSYLEATFDEEVRELHERNDMALCKEKGV
ncbi:hypothetical protein MA16_Dca020613 [Dendrobium catenatum]|uniref:Uncharacterized protein n=1 Tax=Dendrobium catenatum TaxID=906689 RepID=A0A2I0W390_9ASPA|nr:hypothetical protein MA16_Dca020613 [Dendrobium catenatum]